MSVEGVSSLLMTSSAGGSCSVPVEHLDYGYIGQCANLKYLEKILHVLRSGTEGAYPHLTDFCEKRIETLDPRHRALRKELRPATAASFTPDEWRHITDELQAWQREITEREQQLMQTPTINTHTLPPVHNRTLQRPTNTTTHSKPRAVPREYGDWDRFDVDAECAKVDEPVNNNNAPAVINSPHSHVTHHIDTSGLTLQEKCVLATREREKGNEAFRAKEWNEAIVYYIRSLSILPTVAGFNNRAQAEIKLHRWTDALRDCNAVLDIETNNCKALLRRATVYTHLGNLQAACEDLTNVLQSEPNNITAQKLLQEVNKKLNTELSHRPCSPNQPVRGKKILIQEVDDEKVEETKDTEIAQVDRPNQGDTEKQTDGQTERQNDGVRQCADAAAVRREGNELYIKGQYGDAAEKYTHGISTLTQLGVYSEEDMFFLYCNRAACFLKMGTSTECVSDCCRALQLKPFSVKALLRRAMAYETLEQFQLAYVDYRTVQQIHNTHSVQQHVNRLTKVLMEENGSDWRTKLSEVPVVPLSARHDGSGTALMSQTTPTTHILPNTETPPTSQCPPTSEILLNTDAPSRSRRRINIVEVESDVTDDDNNDEGGADDHDDDMDNEDRKEDGAAAADEDDEDEDGAAANDDKDEDGADEDHDDDENGYSKYDEDKDEDDADEDHDDNEDGYSKADEAMDEDGADDDHVDDRDGYSKDDEDKDEDGANDDVAVMISSPDNVFMFGQALRAACCHSDLAACARLLKSVSPHTLSQHISTQLDTHTLSLIIHTLHEHILPTDHGLVYRLLTHLHTIDRFMIVLMLMDSGERRRITQLFECLCVVECDEFTQENINNLANKFI